MITPPLNRLAALGSVLVLAACGHSGNGAAAGGPGGAGANAALHSPIKPAQSGDLDMVAAAPTGKSDTLLQVKFALRQRPVVGAPARIDLQITPGTALDRLQASFSVDEGLTLSEGGTLAVHEHPEPGIPISHTLTLVPSHEGIYAVRAAVLADATDLSTVRIFSVPVIVGAGKSAE